MSYHVEKLIESGLQANEIAVVAPYNLQVKANVLRRHTCDYWYTNGKYVDRL